MAKRQRRLLHGWKLTEATRERAKKICRLANDFPQNGAIFPFASSKWG
jgi:predicted nucleotidyltransferase